MPLSVSYCYMFVTTTWRPLLGHSALGARAIKPRQRGLSSRLTMMITKRYWLLEMHANLRRGIAKLSTTESLSPVLAELLNLIRQFACTSISRKSLQPYIVQAISRRLPYSGGVGFYTLNRVDSEMLILGSVPECPRPKCSFPSIREFSAGIAGNYISLSQK
jgi:hypothetical protein